MELETRLQIQKESLLAYQLNLLESAYLQFRDLEESTHLKEKISNCGRLLLLKTKNSNDEKFYEHEKFLSSEAYNNMKWIIF